MEESSKLSTFKITSNEEMSHQHLEAENGNSAALLQQKRKESAPESNSSDEVHGGSEVKSNIVEEKNVGVYSQHLNKEDHSAHLQHTTGDIIKDRGNLKNNFSKIENKCNIQESEKTNKQIEDPLPSKQVFIEVNEECEELKEVSNGEVNLEHGMDIRNNSEYQITNHANETIQRKMVEIIENSNQDQSSDDYSIISVSEEIISNQEHAAVVTSDDSGLEEPETGELRQVIQDTIEQQNGNLVSARTESISGSTIESNECPGVIERILVCLKNPKERSRIICFLFSFFLGISILCMIIIIIVKFSYALIRE